MAKIIIMLNKERSKLLTGLTIILCPLEHAALINIENILNFYKPNTKT
jgi:hypothetical protein